MKIKNKMPDDAKHAALWILERANFGNKSSVQKAKLIDDMVHGMYLLKCFEHWDDEVSMMPKFEQIADLVTKRMGTDAKIQ